MSEIREKDEQSNNRQNGEISIDILALLRAFLDKAWLIAAVSVLCAVLTLLYAVIFITPMYSSSVMLYVNNKSVSVGSVGFSISSSDLKSSSDLANLYAVILKNRTTLETVIERGEFTFSWKELLKMISASTVDSTSVLKITVTNKDPELASEIANQVAEVLKERIADIIEGATMVVVDSAVPNRAKISPSLKRYTLIGFFIGLVGVMAVIAVITIFTDTISGETNILDRFGYPVLARIPDIHESGSGSKYAKYSRYGYYKKHSYGNNGADADKKDGDAE